MSLLNPSIVPRKTYVLVWVALLLLLLANWGIAQLKLGPFNPVFSLGIAFIQMMLMLLFLMHVRYSTALTRVFVAAGFIWFVIMVVLSMNDYLTRGSVPGQMGNSWIHEHPTAPPVNLPKP
jgi:cytochrome c oxidase subunit 4